MCHKSFKLYFKPNQQGSDILKSLPTLKKGIYLAKQVLLAKKSIVLKYVYVTNCINFAVIKR